MVSKKKNDEKNKLKTINKGKARTQQTQGLATLTRKNKKGENGQMLEGGKEKNIYEILKNLANQKKTPGLTPLQLEQHTLGMSDEERQAIVNELKKEGVTITRPRHKAGQEKKQAESQSLQRRQNKEVKEALNQKKEKKPKGRGYLPPMKTVSVTVSVRRLIKQVRSQRRYRKSVKNRLLNRNQGKMEK